MDQDRHYVSGFFAHRAEAEGALSSLVEQGLPRERIQIFDADSSPPVGGPKGRSNEVLTNVLVDGAIGTAVGTGIGALAQVALVAETRTERETASAREVIEASVGRSGGVGTV